MHEQPGRLDVPDNENICEKDVFTVIAPGFPAPRPSPPAPSSLAARPSPLPGRGQPGRLGAPAHLGYLVEPHLG